MKVSIRHRCADATSYRAARTKSLFNVEDGSRFDLDADLPIEDKPWQIGVVVGPSGSGKSSIGHQLFGPEALYRPTGWPAERPVVDGIAPEGDYNAVTAALGAVGLGDVPVWLRPYRVLSNGQQFRADLAKIIAEAPDRIVIDEFTSVVDRQIAKVGAGAFAKSWRRTAGQAVLLTCHYDVLDWLQPDWVYDTAEASFTWGWQRPRPQIEVEIRHGGWGLWPYFKPHHYLDVGPMPFGSAYVGFVDGEPIVHCGMSTKNVGGRSVEGRACRLVVMPEWQGAGVGMRFLNAVCQLQLQGEGHLTGRRMTSLFHTSHPQLVAALRRDRRWRQVSAKLAGADRFKNGVALRASLTKPGGNPHKRSIADNQAYFGGHFRAVQGFRYVGEREQASA